MTRRSADLVLSTATSAAAIAAYRIGKHRAPMCDAQGCVALATH